MDISNERLNMRRQEPLTDDEVTAIINELMRLRAVGTDPTLPYSDPRVSVEAFDGDFMMIDGDLYRIIGAPTRYPDRLTVEELADASPRLYGMP